VTDELKILESKDRKTWIGGSDVAAILGLAPWENATPLATYLKKKGWFQGELSDDPGKRRILRRGKLLEPVVIDMLIDEYELEVVKRSGDEHPNRYVDPIYPFMAAEIDFEWKVRAEDIDRWDLPEHLLGSIQNGEVKTHHWRAFQGKYGEEGTNEIPIEYGCQSLHGQGVTGRDLTLVAVMVGSDNPLIYWQRRDDDILKGIREKLATFWNVNLLGNIEPEPKNLQDILHLFKRRRATVKEATEEIVGMIRGLAEAGAQATAVEARKKELQFQIGKFIVGTDTEGELNQVPGVHALTYGGQEVLTVTAQGRTTIKEKELRKEHPEIASKFSKRSEFYVYRAKKGAL